MSLYLKEFLSYKHNVDTKILMNTEKPWVKEIENLWSWFEMDGIWFSVDFRLILIQLSFRVSTFFL
jgi:hypothetical protein